LTQKSANSLAPQRMSFGEADSRSTALDAGKEGRSD
jgi:hypothetical protein